MIRHFKIWVTVLGLVLAGSFYFLLDRCMWEVAATAIIVRKVDGRNLHIPP